MTQFSMYFYSCFALNQKPFGYECSNPVDLLWVYFNIIEWLYKFVYKINGYTVIEEFRDYQWITESEVIYTLSGWFRSSKCMAECYWNVLVYWLICTPLFFRVPWFQKWILNYPLLHTLRLGTRTTFIFCQAFGTSPNI